MIEMLFLFFLTLVSGVFASVNELLTKVHKS